MKILIWKLQVLMRMMWLRSCCLELQIISTSLDLSKENSTHSQLQFISSWKIEVLYGHLESILQDWEIQDSAIKCKTCWVAQKVLLSFIFYYVNAGTNGWTSLEFRCWEPRSSIIQSQNKITPNAWTDCFLEVDYPEDVERSHVDLSISLINRRWFRTCKNVWEKLLIW